MNKTMIFLLGSLIPFASTLAKDISEMTPQQLNKELSKAITNQNVVLASELIKQGANPDTQNQEGYTALMEAARKGDAESVNDIIQARANLDIQNRYGYTALMWAAQNGYIEIVKALLAAGANANIRDRAGKSALRKAHENGYREILSLLWKSLK